MVTFGTASSPRNSLSELSSPLGLPNGFVQMEQKLKEMHTKEDDSLFYYYSSEDRIVLSHAMFWTMTLPQFFKSKIRKEKLPMVTSFSSRNSLSELGSPLGLPKEFFQLLRQYEEEMLDAFLQDDGYFPELTSLTFVTTRQNKASFVLCSLLQKLSAFSKPTE